MPKIVTLEAGQRFGKLVVIGRDRSIWNLRCDCGAATTSRSSDLRRGNKKSCGCLKVCVPINAGDRFGRLTVIKKAYIKNQATYYLLKCDCGNTKETIGYSLKSGLAASCGCLAQERRAANGKANATHQMTNTKVYKTWKGCIYRCHNKNARQYSDYGGRGIKVCIRWRESFEAFLDDVGYAPSPKHSLDRINVDGDYEPGNVRWATSKQQNLNKRKRARIEQFTDEELLAEIRKRGFVATPRP